MSEMAEIFSDLKELSQRKRADNRKASASILSRSGVVFENKNGGAHLVVSAGRATVDFGPGTGLWIVRGSPARRRGVRKLIWFVEKEREAAIAKATGDQP